MKMIANVTMRQMLEAGVHFGHQTRYWDPKMAPYIYGTRHQIHIINLEYSLPKLREVLSYVANLSLKRGKILFVGTKQAAQNIIREEATRCNMPYVNYRWLGGLLTNYKTIRQKIKRLKDLEVMRDKASFEGLTKKEVQNLMRELNKLENSLGGIKDMGGLPDALFVIDVGHEKIAVNEAKRLSIPVIGIVDTNNSPDNIDYIIPGNDDSLRAIRLYAGAIADTILAARSTIAEEIVKEAAETATPEAEKPAKHKVVTKKAPPAKMVAKKPGAAEAGEAKSDSGHRPAKPSEHAKHAPRRKPDIKKAPSKQTEK
jgi:small subunit ribosomal protein S2